MAKRKQKRKSRSKSKKQKSNIYNSAYEVTTEPIIDKQFQKLPLDVQEQAEELYALTIRQPK